jgi:hypothetical protein
MSRLSASEASVLATQAIVVELIRTLHDEGVLENLDVVGLLQRAKTSISNANLAASPEAVDLIKSVLHDYGQ